MTRRKSREMKKYIYFIFTLIALLSVVEASAQKMPERALVRKGNRLFDKERYAQSADAYQHALNHDSTSFEARYNLGNTMLRRAMADTTAYDDPNSSAAKLSQGFISQAEGLLQAAAADSLRTADERADAFYNLGNTQFVPLPRYKRGSVRCVQNGTRISALDRRPESRSYQTSAGGKEA